MARFQLPNKAYIRGDDQKYYGAFSAIEDAIGRLSDQGNLDPSSDQIATPPPVAALSVTHANGIHDVQVQDNSPAYNGRQYKAYYSQTPDFAVKHALDLGESQNHRANLGAGVYYWGATTKQGNSDESPMVFFGGDKPTAVGQGVTAGPPMQAEQSFTGKYRNSTTPPVRK